MLLFVRMVHPNSKPKPHFSNIVELCWIPIACYLYGFDRIGRYPSATAKLPLALLFTHANSALLLRSIVDVFLLFLFFGIAALGGRWLLRLFHFQDISISEEIIFGLGLGLGFFSLSALALGLLGRFDPVLIRIIFLIIGAGVVADCIYRPFPKGIVMDTLPALRRPSFASTVAGAMIAGLILINLIGALGPETFYDALVYHLALPQAYLLKHAIFPTPHNIFSGIPFNIEMLYGLGLALGGEGLAKLIPWGISIAILCSIALWARRFADAKVGLLAALLFYSCPMVSSQTWYGTVDLGWCFFSFLAIFGMVIGLENAESPNRNWIVLAGIFAGLTMGVKYNAFSILPIALLLLFFKRIWEQKLNWRRTTTEAGIFVLVALFAVLPWLLKNFYFYHNPIFPFFHEIFNGHYSDTPDWRGLVQDAGRDLRPVFTTMSGFLDFLVGPWSRTWDDRTLDSIGVASLACVPALCLARWKTPSLYRLILLVLIAGLTMASLSSRFPRFLIFVIPFLAIAIAAPLASEKRVGVLSQVFPLVVILACGINCCQIFNSWFELGGWVVVSGQKTKAEYLQRSHPGYPTPYYAAAEFVNQLPTNVKVLFFGESRGYYFMRDTVVSSVFISDPFIAEVNKASSPEQIRDYLQDAGITHIFISWWEIIRKSGDQSPFSKKGKDIFGVFADKYLRVVFRNQIFAPAPVDTRQLLEVYELKKDLKNPERPRVLRSPKTALDYEINGLELMRQEQYAQAVESFRIAVQINPNVAAYRANLGAALVSLGKLDEAIVQYRSALNIDPKMAALHRNLGVILAKQGKLTEAVKQLRVALALDPNDQQAVNNLQLIQQLQQK